jgi:hypothetical protein
MVCFRHVIVNTLHKGDNEDNNNKFQAVSYKVIITDCNILTEMTISHNLPDTHFTYEDTFTVCLIDMAVPETHNLRKKNMKRKM